MHDASSACGPWDSDGMPPRGIVRMLPIGVLLFVLFLALPVPASASGVHGAAHPAVSPPPRTGLSWVHVRGPNASLPEPRDAAGLSTGPENSGVLLFGGCGPSQCPMADTWWYGGGAWENLTGSLATSPPARSGAVLAEDPSSGGVLLFGGCGINGTALNDTWLFANGAWSPVNTSAGSPSARCAAAGTSDAADDGVAVFGGIAANGTLLSDLWLFSHGAWRLLGNSDASGPVARSDGALSYDPGAGALVLFGGTGAGNATLSDTEEFVQGHWVLHPLAYGAPSPTGRTAAVFGEDLSLGADLLFGGQNGTAILADTWTFTNGGWTNLTGSVAHPPVGRASASGAFDASDGYELMVGGRTSASGARNETWAFVLPLTSSLTLPTGGTAPGTVVHFAATVSGGLPPYRYNWSFGVGGHDDHLAAPYFAYSTPGIYSIELTILDDRGVTTYANGTLRVSPPALSVALRFAPTEIVPGTTVTLTASAAGGTEPYAAQWSGLPTGCAGNASLVLKCTVRALGQSSVTVHVTDAHGAVATATSVLVVEAAITASTGAIGGASAAAFQHWGWVLVPPLAGAVAMAAYAAYGMYRMGRYEAAAPPAPRPDCYVPPEWSETPREFPSSATLPESLPGNGRP